MKIKNFLRVTGFVLAFSASAAKADFSFSCGEGREKGAVQAEIGFVDSLDSVMKLYLKGVEIADEKLAFKATEENSWIVTVDNGDKGSRRFEFSVGKANVQEFTTSANGKDSKVGGLKKCEYKK